MDKNQILQSLGKKTNGEIYLGVVGAVRTGKSTFIKKCIELLVLPNIEDEMDKKRCMDEIPQSASGKTIMTIEPKFVPSNAANINVNGINYTKNIDSTTRLIDFIREDLKLKGTKEGCGEGECGACTVIVNGKAINSCLMLASSADGKNVITIEGVSDKDKLHPIQEAFMEVGAVQCGYCTPGMILSAKALLDEKPNADEEEIKEALSGNLCRCTGYKKIIQAVILAKDKLNNK